MRGEKIQPASLISWADKGQITENRGKGRMSDVDYPPFRDWRKMKYQKGRLRAFTRCKRKTTGRGKAEKAWEAGPDKKVLLKRDAGGNYQPRSRKKRSSNSKAVSWTAWPGETGEILVARPQQKKGTQDRPRRKQSHRVPTNRRDLQERFGKFKCKKMVGIKGDGQRGKNAMIQEEDMGWLRGSEGEGGLCSFLLKERLTRPEIKGAR